MVDLTRLCICPKCGQRTIGIILSLTEQEVEFKCQVCLQVAQLPIKVAGCSEM